MSTGKSLKRRNRRSRPPRSEAGFTLIELTLAMVILAIIMAPAVTAVFEAQRGMNTFVDRSTTINQAQPVLDSMAQQVRQADAVAEYGGAGPYSQLWLYRASPATSWNYTCTVWVYDSAASTVTAYVTNSPVHLGSPTEAQITASMAQHAQLSGVTANSGAPFQYFSGYPGLVGIDVLVSYPGGSSGGDIHAASAASRVEVEADNAATSTSSGLAALSSTNPSASCY